MLHTNEQSSDSSKHYWSNYRNFLRITWANLPVFAKNIISATYSELGLIGLTNFIPYMFIPLFVGILLDRFNNGYLLAFGTAINSASIYLLSIAQSVPEIMGFRILTGIAHAFLCLHVNPSYQMKVQSKTE